MGSAISEDVHFFKILIYMLHHVFEQANQQHIKESAEVCSNTEKSKNFMVKKQDKVDVDVV